MNVRSISRAARVLLAGAAVTVTATAASPAHANLCSPQPTPSIQLVASKGSFYEHESTKVTVKLSNPSCTSVSVDFWTSDGAALSGSDYVGVPKVRLTFSPGQVERSIDIAGVNDTVQEGLEHFYINLGNASGGTIPYAQKALFVDGVEPR